MALVRRRGFLVGGEGPVQRGASAARTSYGLLYSVQIEHDYYNAAGNRCPDFRVVPTPSCAALMQSLGLLMNDTGAGFTISYVASQKLQLIDWVARQENAPWGNWAALSFALVCGNPGFIGFTDLPIGTNAAVKNIYLTNQAAHLAGDVILLNPGAKVGPRSFVQLTPSVFDVILEPDVLRLDVRATSGEVVISLQGPVEVSPGKKLTVSVDFTGHPEGYYLIDIIRLDQPVGAGTTVLNSIASPTPMCFIDLLLTRPRPEIPGIYAVMPAAIEPVNFVLKFAARATRWVYYIVPQTAEGVLTELRVTGQKLTAPNRKIRFNSGPPVTLPTGQIATPFTAETMLRLYQKSPYQMQLHGRREGRFSDNELSMDYMPVAGASPVWPAPEGQLPGGNRSEIYVYV